MVKRKSRTITVRKAKDGDSFVTEDGEEIRIDSVDTPEKGEAGAGKAREYLKKLIGGKKVRIFPVAKDKYGRTVARVYKGGKSVGKKIKRRRFGKKRT